VTRVAAAADAADERLPVLPRRHPPRDANGMSERAIGGEYRVGRRTIVKSLAYAEPPERQKIRHEPTP
jgi:hypothetical protein